MLAGSIEKIYRHTIKRAAGGCHHAVSEALDRAGSGAGRLVRSVGRRRIQNSASAPPIPSQVVTTGGRVLFDGSTIQDGQNAWQSIGGQEVGTIWGHGSYVAPDWSADWLHRECVFILDRWASESGASELRRSPAGAAGRAARASATSACGHNTYDPASGTITVDPVQAQAFAALSAYYADVFSQRPQRICHSPATR